MSVQDKANITTYTASAATAIFAGLDFSEWMMLGGLLVAIAGFGVNCFFQWRKDRREAKVAAFAIKQARLNIQNQQAQD